MSTYTVNTLSDAAAVVAGQLTLRQAVADANSNPGPDTIAFDPTVFASGSGHTITLTQGQLELTDTSGKTTISGTGSNVLAISGDGLSRVLQIDAGAIVSLSGLTITDGKSTIANAAANTSGGGIYNTGDLSISSCVISDNSVAATALTEYDAGLAMGGGIYATGPLTIADSTLTGNTVTNQPPVSSDENGDELPGSSFGGAIDCEAVLTISGDTIADNSADGFSVRSGDYPSGLAFGGGVYAGGTVTITNSTITGNTAQGGAAELNSYSASASGNASGGGLYAVGDANISNSTITQNAAIGGTGGLDSGYAGGGNGGGIFGLSSVTISGSTIENNSAKATGYYNGEPCDGGGVYAGSALTILKSSVNDNTLTGGPPLRDPETINAAGGGVYTAGSFDIEESSISGNTNTSATPSFGQDGGLNVGGGIAALGGGQLLNSTVATNSVLGGAGYTDQINDYSSDAGNDGDGGGIYTTGAITITNSTIASNSADGGNAGNADGHDDMGRPGGNGSGGGIFTTTTALIILDSTIADNSTAGGTGGTSGSEYTPGIAGVGLAAGVAIASGTATFDNSIISGNISHHSPIGDVSGTINSSSSHNFIGGGSDLTNGVNGNIVGNAFPMLGALANNGGPTMTMLPLAGSPVIDAGELALSPSGISTDQRGAGYPRVIDGSVDIGAVEYQPPAVNASTLSLTASSYNFSSGTSVTLTATVGEVGEVVPTGSVSFSVNGSIIGSANLSGGVATLTTAAFPVGELKIAASYSGDSHYASVSSAPINAVDYQPIAGVTNTVLTASSYLVSPGSAVTLTAAVTGTSGSASTGSVTFSANGASIGTANLSGGTAVLSTQSLPTGKLTIAASYSGDSNNAASVSSSITLVVQTPSQFAAVFSGLKLPTAVVAGAALNLRLPLLLTNTGVASKGLFTINYFVSKVAGLDGSQTTLPSIQRKLSFKAGGRVLLSQTIKLLPASLLGGTYYVVAQLVSPAGLVSEAISPAVAVAGPFVRLSAVVGNAGPATVRIGQFISFAVTITNSGNVTASGILQLAIYPSPDGVTPLSQLAGSVKGKTSITAGKSRTFRTRMKVPAGIAAGSYLPDVSILFSGEDLTVAGATRFVIS